MRFCKGMIVYRPEPVISKIGLLNYQAESMATNTCVDCAISIDNSTFKNLNYNEQLRAIRPLYDYVDGVRAAERLDSSGLEAGAAMFPLF